MAGSQPILQVRHRDSRFSASNQRPIIFTNGVAENLEETSIDGPAITVETAANSQRTAAFNRVVEFEGDHYWMQNNSVFVRVPASGWTQGVAPGLAAQGVAQGTNILSTAGNEIIQNLGLFAYVSSDGEQKLAALFVNNEATSSLGVKIKESKLTSDGSWSAELNMSVSSQALNSTTVAAEGIYGYPYQDGNKVYLQFTSTDGIHSRYVVVDLDTQVATDFISAPTPAANIYGSGIITLRQGPTAWCGYSGIMWQMKREGGGGTSLGGTLPRTSPTSWYVERFAAVFPSVDVNLISGLAPDGINTMQLAFAEGRADLFVDQGRMYGVHFVRGSGTKSGHAIWSLRYDSASGILINDGDVGWNALPPVLRIQDSAVTQASPTNRWKAYNFVDESGVGSVLLELMLNGSQGNLSSFYQWNGPNQEMTLIGQGSDASHARPLIKQGGGEKVFSKRQPYDLGFRIDDAGAPDGTVNLRTRVLGSGQAIKLRWYFTDKKGPMVKQALVQNPSIGSLVGNELQGIVASSGTEVTVQWRAQAQGISLTDEFDIHPVAEDA